MNVSEFLDELMRDPLYSHQAVAVDAVRQGREVDGL